MTKRLYLINYYETLRMDELGLRYVDKLPKEDMYYKYQILGRFLATLPDDVNNDAELVTEKDGQLNLVSSDGIFPVKVEEDVRWRIGRRIVQLRKEKNMTQQQLADATGLRQPNIARIEQGLYATTIDILERIANALDSSVEIIQNPT